ncbi:MAG: redoxin domain-containing protein [Clostridiales bacterium]|nr:redoxin domain-containing protein [Clostridiales bacterium]
MIVAIIVISILLAVGLITFFVGRAVRKANLPQKPENPNKGKGFVAWIKNHIPTKRRLIQVYAALLYNANIKGFVKGEIYTSETTKYMCVPGLNCYSCPGAVGACPMGAFQNSLAASGTRAPYYVLGILALFGLMLARTICGFLCPIGLCQEWLYKIRTPKLKKSRVTRVLSYFKYVILVLAIAIPLIYAIGNLPVPAFCKYICPAGTIGGAVMLLINPSNSNLFGQLGWQFTWKFSLAIVFIVGSVFIFRMFCRFFCPLGAIYGFFNKFALIGVTVDKENCTDCGLCVAHCKMDVKHVGDHECINCGECMAVCPTKAISWKGSKIFLRLNSIGDPVPQEKPLALVEGEVKIGATAAMDNVDSTISVTNGVAATVAVTETAATIVAVPDGAAVEIEQPTETPAEIKKVKTKKPTTFWLELAAWVAAIAVLITALICYNFVDRDDEYVPPTTVDPGGEQVQTGNKVGDVAPDFTLELYNTDGTINLYETRGSITVVNFWATWCTPCVEEIPYFIQLADNHPEITVIAIQGRGDRPVQEFITEQGWTDTALNFAQDKLNGTKCQTFLAMGGKGMWPMTVILDAEGKILYNDTKSFKSYEDLETLVTGFVQE